MKGDYHFPVDRPLQQLHIGKLKKTVHTSTLKETPMLCNLCSSTLKTAIPRT